MDPIHEAFIQELGGSYHRHCCCCFYFWLLLLLLLLLFIRPCPGPTGYNALLYQAEG